MINVILILTLTVAYGLILGVVSAVAMTGLVIPPVVYTGAIIGGGIALLASPAFLVKRNETNIFDKMALTFLLTLPVSIVASLSRRPWIVICLTLITIISVYYNAFLKRRDSDTKRDLSSFIVPFLCLVTAGLLSQKLDVFSSPPLPDDGPSLIALLGNNDIEIHTRAARKLLQYGKEPFLRALKDPDSRVRSRAAHFIGFLEDPTVQPDLIKAANDPDANVRMWVGFSLGKIGNAEAIPTLTLLANDSEVIVRAEARKALSEVNQRK